MSKTAYTSHDGFSRKLNVPTSQAVSLPKGYSHYTQKIPSSQTPTWNSWYTVAIREKGVSLDSLVLEFQTSAITGLTVTNSGTAAYLPTYFWAQRIDIYMGSQLIDSINPSANFLVHQYLVAQSEEKRLLLNSQAGRYDNFASRSTRSAATNFWYLPIASFWNQSSFPLVGTADLEIRVQMASLADSYSVTTGSTATGTPVSTFSACNAICSFSQLPASVRQYTSSIISKSPLHFGFQELHQATYTVSSGISSTNLVMSAITGYVSYLFFTIRSTNPTGVNQFAYNTTLDNFEFLSGGSENIVGGQPVQDNLNRLVQASRWLNTTFSSESAGAYFYSFSLDPVTSWNTNANLSGRQFTGSEILKLTFTTALASAVQVDVFAYTHSALELSPQSVKKIALSE